MHVQIVLGIIVVVGSSIALFFPAITTFTVVYILGIVLIFVGIERILIGIFSPAPGSSRWGTIGLGIIVLIVAGIVVANPLGSTVFLLFVLAIALFCDGIARIVHSLAAQRHARRIKSIRYHSRYIQHHNSHTNNGVSNMGCCSSRYIDIYSNTDSRYPNYCRWCHWFEAVITKTNKRLVLPKRQN